MVTIESCAHMMMLNMIIALLFLILLQGICGYAARITLASGINPTYLQLCIRDLSTITNVKIGGQYALSTSDPSTAPSPTWFLLQQTSFDASCFYQGASSPVAWFAPASVRVTLAGGTVIDFVDGIPSMTPNAKFDVVGTATTAGAPMPATPPLAEPAGATAKTSDGPFRAGATFFTAAVTACKITSAELTSAYTDRYVAINSHDWISGRQCGRCMRVSNADGSSSTELVVIDQCPSDGGKCYNFNWLDVSPEGFAAIGKKSWGVMQIDWEFVQCASPTVSAPGGADQSNLLVRFESWSTGAGFEMQVANVRTKLTAVSIHSQAAGPSQLEDGGWIALSSTNHNTWTRTLPSGANLNCPCHLRFKGALTADWRHDPVWDAATGQWGPFALDKDIADLPKWPTFLGTGVSLLTSPTKAPTSKASPINTPPTTTKTPNAAPAPAPSAASTPTTGNPAAPPASPTAWPQPQDTGDDGDGELTTGMLIFIVAGAGAVVIAVALGVCVWRRKRQQPVAMSKYSDGRGVQLTVAQPDGGWAAVGEGQ